MSSINFGSRMHKTTAPANGIELEPVEVRRFEIRKHWPLRGWWRGHVGRLLGSYLAFHEKEEPQLRDCELGPILGPTPGSRYGLWAVRSLAAQRQRARVLVRHEQDVTIYEARQQVKLADLEELDRLAHLLLRTRDLELPRPCVVRKVLVAFDCDAEARAEATMRSIKIVTSYQPHEPTRLHVPRPRSSGLARKRLAREDEH
jgi:hypothetical protein